MARAIKRFSPRPLPTVFWNCLPLNPLLESLFRPEIASRDQRMPKIDDAPPDETDLVGDVLDSPVGGLFSSRTGLLEALLH
jgi:hypothetical protein